MCRITLTRISVVASLLIALASTPAAAQGVPIGALPNATTPLSGAELMALSQNGQAVKATVSTVAGSSLIIPTGTVLGNVSGVTQAASAITAAQLQTLLGLGTAAYQNIGTSGASVPLMSTANTWSGGQTFSAGITLSVPLAIMSGGTGATTAQGARLNILPSIAGNAGKALIVNPGETDFTYSTTAVGSVTSIGLAGTANEITVGGSASPITTSGAWTLSLPTALTFTGKTITGGAFTGATWNNGIIGGSTAAAGTFTALTATAAVALSPANANVVLSPTGTGIVTINPATAGTINNVVIGGSTPLAGTFTTLATNGADVFTLTSAGASTVPLSLVNASASANTEVTLDLNPSSGPTGSRTAQIAAINNGSNAIDTAFRNSNGGSPAEVMRITAGRRVLIGNSSALTLDGNVPSLQVQGTSSNLAASAVARFSNDAAAPRLYIAKSRGTTVGTNTVVQSGDSLAFIAGLGADGTGYIPAASILMEVDGTPGTNDMPGRLVFSTTADGAASVTERMRISNAGLVSISSGAANSLTLAGSASNPTIGTTSGSVAVSAPLVLSQTTLLATSVSLTNGAAAQVGTLTNAPTAGNPTKWIPINDNGTTRYIPAW